MGCCGGGFSSFFQQRQPQVTPEKQYTPLEILRERLAKGEITQDEYRKLAEVLTETTNAR